MKYYTVSEVAKKYKVSKETIYKRIREGVISRARNKGNVIRISASELKKIQNQYMNDLVYDKEKVEIVETSLGKIRKIKLTDEYVARDIANAIGLAATRTLVDKASNNNARCIDIDEAKCYGFEHYSKGTSLINYDGVVEYSKRSAFNIDWDKFLKELKPSNENIQADECSQIEFEEAKTDNSNA
ncbi:helix-turn-helix domain-containing protein, partial [Clostridium neonatale]